MTDEAAGRPAIATVVWAADPVLDGFDAVTIPLPAEDDGTLAATLVRGRANGPAQGAVLHLHGFVDFFFQAHVARQVTARGWHWYALDQRRSGRSLRTGNRPYYLGDVSDVFREIDDALDVIMREAPGVPVVLWGHSTGGLVALRYAQTGTHRARLAGLVLNSPFVAFRASPPERAALPVAEALGGGAPHVPIPGVLAPSYVESLHTAFRGEWTFDLAWKPREGFPAYLGWIRAIRRAQAALRRDPVAPVPTLLLRSDRTVRGRRWRPAMQAGDAVLDPADMAAWAARAGAQVEDVSLAGAMHDVFLSAPPVRAAAFDALHRWLAARAPDRLPASR